MCAVMEVLVVALFTVCVNAADVLAAKLLFPPYAAVIECPPEDRPAVLNVVCPELFSDPVPRIVTPS